MRIGVLSGKGGTGKTFVSTSLAVALGGNYFDCDVEEPNGSLFFKPLIEKTVEVFKNYPVFDVEKCCGCRACVDFCKFNALAFIKNAPVVFKDVCHQCGGCQLVCGANAVSYAKRPIGVVEQGVSHDVHFVGGRLNLGEASGVDVIKTVCASKTTGDVVIDCPPGSACTVMDSIASCDACVIVAEPTAFSLDNFKMIEKLCQVVGKKAFVVVNKYENCGNPLEDYLKKSKLKLVSKIPYDKEVGKIISCGEMPYCKVESIRKLFDKLAKTLKSEVGL